VVTPGIFVRRIVAVDAPDAAAQSQAAA
jgi:hypothetical protein